MLNKLLSKFSGQGKTAAPISALGVRRAHQPAAYRAPVGRERREPRADASPVLAEVTPAPVIETAAIEITSDTALPNWRGLVADVVREKDAESCVVLDLQYRSVMVLGTPEFFGSGAHGALLSTLQTRNLSRDAEKTTTKEVIAAVRARAERIAQTQLGANVETEAANVQLYKDLIGGAFNLNASDVHILLDLAGRSTVRLRIDGKSRDWRTFDTSVLSAALAAGYSSLTIPGTNSNADWTIDRPINTITAFKYGNADLNGRLTTEPVTGGAKIVIRVADASSDAITKRTLHTCGFTDEQIHQQILPALSREKGFILVGGSTGAGKTVTLQCMMMALPGREWKEIYAIEDPNEARIPGVAHHSIQRNTDDPPEKVKVQFDSAFMTQMRMDPDVIIIGEIRDRTSADLATEAVLTGHLLGVTMHGNSAIGQLFRLMNPRIGMDPEVLADEENFAASMAQYLVPLLCEHCKVPAHDVMAENDLALLRTRWRLDTRKMFCASGTGCKHCARDGIKGNGEKGRIVAAEIITDPTPAFLQCLLKRDKAGAELAWRRTRRAGFDSPDMQGKTSFENALYHVSRGLVSPLSVSEVFGKRLDAFKVVELADDDGADVVHLAAERAA